MARLERLEAGAPALQRAATSAQPRAQLPIVVSPRPVAGLVPADVPAASLPTSPGVSDAAAILEAMGASGRTSLGQALKTATATLENDTLVLSVGADFTAFAQTHGEEYEALASQAAGRKLKVRIAAGRSAPSAVAGSGLSPTELSRQRLRQVAETEPAVQEALDLFSGKVVDVREAKG